MNLATAGRIISAQLLKGNRREQYWAARAYLALTARLLQSSNRAFARRVVTDYWRFLLQSLRPIEGEIRERAQAAADWLLTAQVSTPDDGVSLGYFPCDSKARNGWKPSYPETTGYIIPSLLEFARRFENLDVRQRALRMAVWETKVQMASGAVQGGPVCAPERQSPAVFNTGMVLHGYTAAYRESKDPQFLEAARRAANFLISDMQEDGHFRTHGTFVGQHRIKTYNCLCAWPLYRFGEDISDDRYQKAAVTAVQAAVEQQQSNGWFSNNCLTDPRAPLSHTIGYTFQGILEVGILAGREDFFESVRKGIDAVLEQMSSKGFLPGRFAANWEPAVFSSCLTGNAQIAVVCYRLHEKTRDPKYCFAAERLVNYLKPLQIIDENFPQISGAIPGSFPIMGGYMTAGYPNWATKYYLDALLLQDRVREAR
jgi:hypothetical protein